MQLFFRKLGRGQPLIILHGLMGSSDNWLTQAKMLASHYHVFMVDQRNHGKSPHSDEFDYKVLSADIKNFIEQQAIQKPIILGHSMGGKAAMNFAVTNPTMLDRLIIVDIAPKEYPVRHDNIVEGLKAIPIDSLKSRVEADEVLSTFVEEAEVRQFLLKNLLRKSEGGFTWKINLPVIDKNLELAGAGMQFPGIFEGPTLFVRGKKSNYVKEEDRKLIKTIFPNAVLVSMDTGHWVQAEKPQEFVEVVNEFLEKTK